MRFWKKRATRTTVAEQLETTDIRILLAGQPVTGRMIGHWISCNGVLTCRWKLESTVEVAPRYQLNAALPKSSNLFAWEGAISSATDAIQPQWRPAQEIAPFTWSNPKTPETLPHRSVSTHATR